MTGQAVSADEQLTVHYGPGMWRLHGPDGAPVLEARPHMIYYHPLFGRWRDLPPGDRMSVDGIDSIQVRWDSGWAVGLLLSPHGLWRPLVRWGDTRQIATADEAARALSDLIGRPLRAEGPPGEEPARLQERPQAPLPEVTPLAAEPPPPELPPADIPALEPAPPPVYTVEDGLEVRLPLRLGGGSLLDQDKTARLVLTIAAESRRPSLAITSLGAGAVVIFAAIIWSLSSGLLGGSPLLRLAAAGAALIALGLGGMWLLIRLNRQLERRTIFDRAAGTITLPPGPGGGGGESISLRAVHGVRIFGEAVRTRSTLAYRRTVLLITETGDIALFAEMRPTALPPDPAVMPSLPALRRQADERAGPSLARAGARVIAAYLGVPLADE